MTIEDILDNTASRIEQLEIEMSSPDVIGDQNRMKELAREHRRLSELQNMNEKLKRLKAEIEDLKEAIDDPELAELAEVELPEKEEELERLKSAIKRLLVPESTEDARNAVLEIRAGTGGEEAALFGTDLYKMYTRYFENAGWKAKVVNSHFSDLGGVKEITLSVSGEDVYGKLKYESGVHRVQRVPVTEASGRIHTSAATVAVLPEAEEVDVEIDPKDLKIDTYRSSGPGGQHVNKTDSAIRITYLPTGLVVTCQDEKSQYKNKIQALKVLRSRLYKQALEEEQNKRTLERRTKVSTGDRSAKIRTYNFPQGRVTDHRPPLTLYRLEEILAGELDILLDPLHDFFASERLAEIMNEEKLV